MTEPTKPLATGSMSSSGTTTVVKINRPNLDAGDKKVLCSAICKCKAVPGIGEDGRSLKQSCVSGQLKSLDEILKHTSPYKAEVNYDMTKQPPEPIMDSEIATKTHGYLPGWIKKYWDAPGQDDNQRPKFKPGKGYVRRPDVVIVTNPNNPPTQDNIKQVVEIKFPPDTMGDPQRRAYENIAGGANKLVELGPDDCDCNQPDPNPSKIPVEQIGTAATVGGILYMLLTKKPPPIPAY